jgi:hypothetical protein
MVISQFSLPSLVRSASVCGSRRLATSTLFGLGDFGRRQVADEHRLLAEDRLDRLARLDLREIDFGRAFGQHVGRGRHLADQRIERRRCRRRRPR